MKNTALLEAEMNLWLEGVISDEEFLGEDDLDLFEDEYDVDIFSDDYEDDLDLFEDGYDDLFEDDLDLFEDEYDDLFEDDLFEDDFDLFEDEYDVDIFSDGYEDDLFEDLMLEAELDALFEADDQNPPKNDQNPPKNDQNPPKEGEKLLEKVKASLKNIIAKIAGFPGIKHIVVGPMKTVETKIRSIKYLQESPRLLSLTIWVTRALALTLVVGLAYGAYKLAKNKFGKEEDEGEEVAAMEAELFPTFKKMGRSVADAANKFAQGTIKVLSTDVLAPFKKMWTKVAKKEGFIKRAKTAVVNFTKKVIAKARTNWKKLVAALAVAGASAVLYFKFIKEGRDSQAQKELKKVKSLAA